MKRIRYLLDYRATDGSGISRVLYQANETYDIDDNSERHVGQGLAEYVEDKQAGQAKKQGEKKAAKDEAQADTGADAASDESPKA
ncbi:hypothetical protein [Chitinimonas sp.]|uniref:hypothetical protein n=1 Tax=Chitinimonas sp. TaxID=1934313 RepID=UPI0035B4459C